MNNESIPKLANCLGILAHGEEIDLIEDMGYGWSVCYRINDKGKFVYCSHIFTGSLEWSSDPKLNPTENVEDFDFFLRKLDKGERPYFW